MLKAEATYQMDVENIRKDFPILKRMVNGKPLIYFDNGATTQKPLSVIEAITRYYTHQNSNIHRGVHALSREITELYEESRKKVQQFIGARHLHEIVFTRGTTESINLVANCFAKIAHFKEGDEILVTEMEHHSNIVPWQMLCEERGLKLKYVPILENGELDREKLIQLLSDKTRLFAFTHISNTLGTINPVKELCQMAHQKNIPVLVDGAQAVAHTTVDVQELDADFYVFSGHKMFGPTGIGVLYGKEQWLQQFPPYQGGGGIIKTVSFEKTEYAESPLRFEAGTPNIEGSIGLAAAIDYIQQIGLLQIQAYEEDLLKYFAAQIKEVPGLRIIGQSGQKASVMSLVADNVHPFDVGMILDKLGIAVRTGHHCTQPLMKRYGVPGTIRASLSFYNTKEEIDVFMEGLKKAFSMLR